MLDFYFKGLGCPVGKDGEVDVDTYMGFPNARAEFVEIMGLQAFYISKECVRLPPLLSGM
jgi:hypothetical protein